MRKSYLRGKRKVSSPTLLRFGEAERVVWGDERAHYVSDWYWGVGKEIYLALFSLRSGEYFRHSGPDYLTLYHDHRFVYPLDGAFVTHNPRTGEVHTVAEGTALYLQPGVWWYAYNFTPHEVKIVEVITLRDSKTTPRNAELKVKGAKYELLTKWPVDAEKTARTETMKVIHSEDMLEMIEGENNPTLVSLYFSLTALTAGKISLLPGRTKDAERHPGEEFLLVTKGRLNVFLPDTREWYEVNPLDAFYTPGGVRHQYFNMSDQVTSFLFAVSPRYK